MRVHISPRRLVAAARARTRQRAGRLDVADESGFSLVEGVTALVLIFGIMLGLFASLNTGIQGLLTGRSRDSAIGRAKYYVEQIKSACYERIGHDYALDLELATSPLPSPLPDNLTYNSVTGNWEYDPDGGGAFAAEPLAQAGSCGGSQGAVVPKHHDTDTIDNNTYEYWIYITHVDPGTGIPHKRVTVEVQWGNAQYGANSGVEDKVRVSTLVYDGDPSSDSLVDAEVDTDGGTLDAAGTLYDPTLPKSGDIDLDIVYPHAYALQRSMLIDEVSGWARTHSATFTDTSNPVATPTGCTKPVGSDTISCASDTASVQADNDSGTVDPLWDDDDAYRDPVEFATTPLYDIDIGEGTGDSAVTTCGTLAGCLAVGDNDGNPGGIQTGDGPDSVGFDFSQLNGLVQGSLIDGGGVVTDSRIDQDAGGVGMLRTIATSQNTYSGTDLLTIQNAGGVGIPLTIVEVGGGDVSATADVGATAGGADFGGAGLTVTVLGIAPISVHPGDPPIDASYPISRAIEAPVVGTVATVDATVRVVSQQGTTDEDYSGKYVMARAEVDDWLRIIIDVTITTATETLLDVLYEVNYGDLSAYAEVDA